MSIKFEKLNVAEPKHDFIHGSLHRAPVPGGWLIAIFYNSGHAGGPAICFYPDAEHEWDGDSLEGMFGGGSPACEGTAASGALNPR